MLHRHEAPAFKEREWICVSLKAPLGPVLFARKLPVRAARPSGTMSDWITRRFAPSNPPDPGVKRLRVRRSL